VLSPLRKASRCLPSTVNYYQLLDRVAGIEFPDPLQGYVKLWFQAKDAALLSAIVQMFRKTTMLRVVWN
jgi:hypothetical protein